MRKVLYFYVHTHAAAVVLPPRRPTPLACPKDNCARLRWRCHPSGHRCGDGNGGSGGGGGGGGDMRLPTVSRDCRLSLNSSGRPRSIMQSRR